MYIDGIYIHIYIYICAVEDLTMFCIDLSPVCQNSKLRLYIYDMYTAICIYIYMHYVHIQT